jgi:hypothetical protein
MPDYDYAITNLLARNATVTQQYKELTAKVDDLATPAGERCKLAYQQASDWLRMVNTITWTLSSIFLVGAIIALNGASQPTADPAWRLGAYLLVFVLCAIWWRVDWIYGQSALKAREMLVRIEENWAPTHAFYRSQNDAVSVRLSKSVARCIYLPILAVMLLAAFLAAKTIYATYPKLFG